MSFLKGLDGVIANLNKEIKAIEGRSLVGLVLAVGEIRRDMDTISPVIPVDTGNLRGSWFAEPLNMPAGPAVVCGFAANYAAFVHEMLGAHFQRPGAGPKFFQAAIRRSKERTLRIIAENARIR